MTLLIANIGTSDLTVKIGDRFLPVGFDRIEPNENREALTAEEEKIWNERLNIVRENLGAELGVTVTKIREREVFSFRELSQKLWEAYQREPDRWHHRLYLGRILGSIDRAIAMGATKAHIFVTDQKPRPHEQDTVYLFYILQKWLGIERPKFTIEAEVIPERVSANDADSLLNFYYFKFIELTTDLINPQLDVKNLKIGQVVRGEVSGFQDYGVFLTLPNNIKGLIPIAKVSQEFMTPAKLRQKFYIGEKIRAKITDIKDNGKLEFSTRDLQSSNEVILVSIKGGTPQMVEALKLQAMSVAASQRLFLIDTKANIKRILSGQAAECQLTAHWRYVRSQKYETVKQLLGRWDFDGAIAILRDWQDYLDVLIAERVIDFEDVKHNLEGLIPIIKALEMARAYFNLDIKTVDNILTEYPFVNDANFNPEKILADYKHFKQYRVLHLFTLCRVYWQLDQMFSFLSGVFSCCDVTLEHLIYKYCPPNQFSCFSFDTSYLNLPQAQQQLGDRFWLRFVHLEDHEQNPRRDELTEAQEYRLVSRYNKRNFIEALIGARGSSQDVEAWDSLKANFIQLDFWGNKRNKFVHSASGISKDLMVSDYEALKPDQQSKTCRPDRILAVMEEICHSGLLGIDWRLGDRFARGADADYYIYSEIRDWVGQRLARKI
ncbi:MAG: S1 RNA-binding domain-containing protein [Pseudanabaena sp. ELA645]|jgi:predicted RNA-binding protein with RPS1 domain